MRVARALAALAAAMLLTAGPGFAQKPGGILRFYHPDSPASMSILEEATPTAAIPMMGVFNTIAMYKQDVPQSSMKSIIPDLATAGRGTPTALG